MNEHHGVSQWIVSAKLTIAKISNVKKPVIQQIRSTCLLFFTQVSMIIKGLFRRYERWNPVHPTFGAFWGMGVGFGCGVGWGPGFGPEVVGYVGAGCGVGFSVGITLFGLGIGLPANNIFEVPYNAIVATRRHALPFVQSGGLLSGDGWNNIAPSISVLHRETSRRFSSLNKKVLLDNGVDLFKMQSKLNVQAKSFSKDLETLCSRFFHYREGPKD